MFVARVVAGDQVSLSVGLTFGVPELSSQVLRDPKTT